MNPPKNPADTDHPFYQNKYFILGIALTAVLGLSYLIYKYYFDFDFDDDGEVNSSLYRENSIDSLSTVSSTYIEGTFSTFEEIIDIAMNNPIPHMESLISSH
jgi:hypothetical protein